jgi:hypothetical protein
VALVGRLANAKLVSELKIGIAQEGKGRAKAGLKGSLNLRRVDGNNSNPAVGNFSRVVELDQLPQLYLSLGSPWATVERENQRLATRQLSHRDLALIFIDEAD